jgi:hypothetical protein
MFVVLFIFLVLIKVVSADYTAEALADQVLSLPGAEGIADKINFNQFSGYLKVGNTKNLHYWYNY